MKGEKWKPVAGWPYEVSSEGRVRNVRSGRVMKAYDMNGYLYVTLCRNGTQQREAVHRLVLESFGGEGRDGMHCNHRDADKVNNRATNLEWVTPQENAHHAISIGLCNPVGEGNPNSRLTASEVLQMLDMLPDFGQKLPMPLAKDLAGDFGVSWRHIYKIHAGDRWEHLQTERIAAHADTGGET